MTPQPPFEEVVTRHGPTVWRVCRAVLGPWDADDAWSETFVAALRAYPDLPAGANVEAWLVTIAHRKAIDVTRRARRTSPREEDPTPSLQEADLAPTPAELTATRVDLTAALATLPDKQRYAVVYHHLAGLPYADVAAIVGGTPAAARRAAADGIARLRPLLKEPHDDL